LISRIENVGPESVRFVEVAPMQQLKAAAPGSVELRVKGEKPWAEMVHVHLRMFAADIRPRVPSVVMVPFRVAPF
jgi:hypothetical protein